jgi:hypothetical protein
VPEPITWRRHAAARQGIPGAVSCLAEGVGDHTVQLIGDLNRPPGEQFVSLIDGRLVSDGRTTREAATEAAERRLGELRAPEARREGGG